MMKENRIGAMRLLPRRRQQRIKQLVDCIGLNTMMVERKGNDYKSDQGTDDDYECGAEVKEGDCESASTKLFIESASLNKN